MSFTRTPLRVIAAAAVMLFATAAVATTASAAETPPAASEGFASETWGDPTINDLFTVSASSWKGVIGVGWDQATVAAVSITANQDITLTAPIRYSDPDTITLHRSGVCPAPGSTTGIAMAEGDVCQLWFTYGPGAISTPQAYVSGVNISASTAGGTTATAYYGQEMIITHVQVGDPVDFGEVTVGDTANGSFSVTNITPDPVQVDLSELLSGGPIGLAADQPAAIVLDAGQTADVAVAFTPSATGAATGTWWWVLNSNTVGQTATSGAYPPAMSGVGVGRQAALSADPVDFGSVLRGSAADQPLTVTNTGAVPVRVTVDPSQVEGLSVDLPDTVVQPGDTLLGTVTWTAQTDLTSAQLTLTADDAGSVTPEQAATPVSVQVPVSGVITAPSDPTTPDTTDPVVPGPVVPDPIGTPAVDQPTPPASGTTVGNDDPQVRTGLLATTGLNARLVGMAALATLAAGALLLAARHRRSATR